jgi:hypothetical protein
LEQHISTDLTERRYTEEAGWGLYSTRDISPRERIISIMRPLVISLDIPRLKDTCYFCLGYPRELGQIVLSLDVSADEKLQICTGCHVVRYCSKVGAGL